ncbi:uncharacterized protein LOC128392815 [Panonychus citri]|uniref:uncharacterized protein LOC128392815 n=1 Tax=Panonychus citri TaxID=50023 RepID=UPI0023073A08|nr:uncharacterized protein LOC128392815 [Panonychus citri]
MGISHCCSSHYLNMVPTLRLPSALSGITLAQLVVIVTLLPFSFQSKYKDSQLVIYSNGPCLMIRFFESQSTDLTPSFPSFPSLRPLEVPLKIAGKNCSQNDPGWITSVDYFMDPVTLDFHLIWADSDSSTLWTGRVNSTNYHISDVKQLRDNNDMLIGARVRSLIVDSGKMFISLPYLHRIEMYDLIGGLSIAQKKSNSFSINLNRTILSEDTEKIGKVLYNVDEDKLFWIEENKCLWFGTPSSQKIMDRKRLMCTNSLTDGLIYSAVIDSETGDIYVFSGKGKIERLSGPNWSQRTTVISNCLAEEKYQYAKFYTIKMMKEKNFLKFYASDTQHYAFRQISLIKRFKTGNNDEGDNDEYILDKQNSGILFTDAPNIYDFIFPGDDKSKSKVISSPRDQEMMNKATQAQDEHDLATIIYDENLDQDEDLDANNVAISSSSSSRKYQSMTRPKLELINKQDLPESTSSSKLFRRTELPVNNLDSINSLSNIIVSSSSSSPSPIEGLPPQITLLTVTSSSTIIYWLYGFLSIGLIIAVVWILLTLIGLKRNYQKVYTDDNSLKENLTSVKY